MSQFALRLPNSLHGYANEVAQQDETSLNQFIVTAVAEKLSAMRTEEFFRERAAKAKPPGQNTRQSAGHATAERCMLVEYTSTCIIKTWPTQKNRSNG